MRTAFVLLHVPALIAIGAFPLAPPMWLPHPLAWPGKAPTLTGSLSVALRNQTATVASEHFGYPVLIAAGTLWTARGRPITWPIVIYPTWVFLFIIGTGHHYPLDAVVGTLCVIFGFAGASLLHRSRPSVPGNSEPRRRWVALAAGAGLSAGWVNGLASGSVRLGHPGPLTFAAPTAAAIALSYARRHRVVLAHSHHPTRSSSAKATTIPHE